jgi:hypothetical protein
MWPNGHSLALAWEGAERAGYDMVGMGLAERAELDDLAYTDALLETEDAGEAADNIE